MTSKRDAEARAVIGRLLAAAGRRGPVEDGVEAVEYEWTSPHRFTPPQREHLAGFATDAARRMDRCLGGLLRGQWGLRAEPMREFYGPALRERLQGEGAYCVAITRGGQTVGLLALPAAAAMSVMQRLLGGGDEVEEGRELSALEQALFVDTMAELGRAISEALEAAGGPHLSRGEELHIGTFPLPGDVGTQFGGLVFASEQDDSKCLSVYLLSDLLAESCPASEEQGGSGQSPEEEMLQHISMATVTATVEVGSATLSVRDIMDIEPGDVILLQREADGPVDLAYQGRLLLKGYPGRSEDHYALQVEQFCGTEVA